MKVSESIGLGEWAVSTSGTFLPCHIYEPLVHTGQATWRPRPPSWKKPVQTEWLPETQPSAFISTQADGEGQHPSWKLQNLFRVSGHKEAIPRLPRGYPKE